MTVGIKRRTRKQRVMDKINKSKKYDISVATINFKYEVNAAHVVRLASCFGADKVFIIGDYPQRRIMNSVSGSLFEHTNVVRFDSVNEFLEYVRNQEINLVSVELPSKNFPSTSILDYKFDGNKTCVVVGNETTGISADILKHSEDIIYIPMDGIGSCLNTSQAANIVLYEAVKQYKAQEVII